MPFACIYVPNFPVAAALRAEPELQARAVAILEGKPPLEKTIAVNPKAARMGITPGMTKAQAELCAELALRPRSPLQESAAHAALLDCAQSFSPCIEDAACDTVLLDLAARYGSETGDEVHIAVPLSQEELASLAGTSRATVTRALSNWRRRGIIRTGQRDLTITDLGTLRKIAGQQA